MTAAVRADGHGAILDGMRAPVWWPKTCSAQHWPGAGGGHARRDPWFRTTGRSGRWVVPDGEQVASEWDADTTLWLTDTIRESEEPRQQWRRESTADAWTRCAPSCEGE